MTGGDKKSVAVCCIAQKNSGGKTKMESYLIKLSTLGFVGLCVLVSGCATGTRAKGPTSATFVIEGPKELPDWVKNPNSKSTKEAKAFIGQSIGLWASERSAIDSAMTDAKRAAVHFLWGEMIETQVKAASAKGGVDTGVLYTQEAEKMKEVRKAQGIVRGERGDYVSQRVEEVDTDGSRKAGWRARVIYMVPKSAMSEYAKEFMRDVSANEKDEKARQQVKDAVSFIDKTFEEWDPSK